MPRQLKNYIVKEFIRIQDLYMALWRCKIALVIPLRSLTSTMNVSLAESWRPLAKMEKMDPMSKLLNLAAAWVPPNINRAAADDLNSSITLGIVATLMTQREGIVRRRVVKSRAKGKGAPAGPYFLPEDAVP